MRAKITILSICLLAAFAGTALAQTPDGQTPAVETVCNTQMSGAPFGLCNAFCEAMDCELENDGDPLTEPNASSTACNRVRRPRVMRLSIVRSSAMVPPGSLFKSNCAPF